MYVPNRYTLCPCAKRTRGCISFVLLYGSYAGHSALLGTVPCVLKHGGRDLPMVYGKSGNHLRIFCVLHDLWGLLTPSQEHSFYTMTLYRLYMYIFLKFWLLLSKGSGPGLTYRGGLGSKKPPKNWRPVRGSRKCPKTEMCQKNIQKYCTVYVRRLARLIWCQGCHLEVSLELNFIFSLVLTKAMYIFSSDAQRSEIYRKAEIVTRKLQLRGCQGEYVKGDFKTILFFINVLFFILLFQMRKYIIE